MDIYIYIYAKSLQSCPTLCDPIDGSPPGSPVSGIPQARMLEWVAISFSNASKWKVKVKSLSCVDPQWPHGLQPSRLLCPWDFPGKNTGVGCYGIPVELVQILKDDAVKVLHSICQQIWNTQQWSQDWKRSVFIPTPKHVQTTAQLHLSHMLAK